MGKSTSHNVGNKVTPEEGVLVESAFKMQRYIYTNTLLHTAFSAILPVGVHWYI